jgi:hypothetical protein
MNISFALVEREKLRHSACRIGKIVLLTEAGDSDTPFELMRKRIAEEPGRYNAWSGSHTLVLLASPAMHNRVMADNWTFR